MKFFNTLIAHSLPLVPKFIMAKIAKRYVAGETLSQAVKTVRELNQKGMMATIDVLGEEIKEAEKTKAAVASYREVLRIIEQEKLDCNISVKLSQLGLKFNQKLCLDNMHEIMKAAGEHNNFIRIDMEDSSCTQATIEIFSQLQQEYPKVGLVLQAYLRRTSSDINRLLPLKPNIRLCKGIYIEKRSLAYQDPQIINQNYLFQLEKLMSSGCYPAIATHDEKLVVAGMQLAEKYGLQPQDFEFQMLLGVDPELREIIISQGYRLRVYVPFGGEWLSYCRRRLKENPAIVGYVIEQVLGLAK